MENYERTISLKTIWLTLVRRYDGILFIFLPILLASFLVTNFMITKTYQSSVVVNNTAVVNTAQHQQFGEVLKKSETATTTANNLKAAKIKHANGAEISASEILGGVNLSALASNSISMTITFQSTDSSITKYVLDEVAKVAAATAKETISGFGGLTVADAGASAAKKNSKDTQYFLIAAVAGLVVALGVPFVYEIFADEVYDAKDIQSWGVPASLIDCSKGVKMEPQKAN